MRINIDTTPERVYRQIVEVIRSFPPLDVLRNKELDVLAVLMYYNYKYKNIDEDIRWRVIHDTSTKREMQKDIGMTEDIFNNNLSLVRKAGLLDKSGKIPKWLMFDIGDKFELNFNFNVKKEELL